MNQHERTLRNLNRAVSFFAVAFGLMVGVLFIIFEPEDARALTVNYDVDTHEACADFVMNLGPWHIPVRICVNSRNPAPPPPPPPGPRD